MKIDKNTPAASRNVAKRTKRPRRAHVMCSPKSGGVELRFESRLELSVATALELDPRVRSYRTQPFTLDLTSGARLAEQPRSSYPEPTYTVDFLIDLGADRYVAAEVKPSRFVERYEGLFETAHRVLRSQGVSFLVITDEQFPGHYLRNFALLAQAARQSARYFQGWLEELINRPATHLTGHVREVCKGQMHTNHVLMAALLGGLIKCDLSKVLLEEMNFEVEPAHGSLSAFEVIDYE